MSSNVVSRTVYVPVSIALSRERVAVVLVIVRAEKMCVVTAKINNCAFIHSFLFIPFMSSFSCLRFSISWKIDQLLHFM